MHKIHQDLSKNKPVYFCILICPSGVQVFFHGASPLVPVANSVGSFASGSAAVCTRSSGGLKGMPLMSAARSWRPHPVHDGRTPFMSAAIQSRLELVRYSIFWSIAILAKVWYRYFMLSRYLNNYIEYRNTFSSIPVEFNEIVHGCASGLSSKTKGSFPSNEHHNATSVDLLRSSQSSICIVRSFTFIRMLVAAPEVGSIDFNTNRN